LFELLGLRAQEVACNFGLTDNQIRVLDSFGYFEQSAEQISGISGMTLNDANYALVALEKFGLVLRTSSGWVKTSNTL
jgi:DNA-binding MarR family transcriptional regulator